MKKQKSHKSLFPPLGESFVADIIYEILGGLGIIIFSLAGLFMLDHHYGWSEKKEERALIKNTFEALCPGSKIALSPFMKWLDENGGVPSSPDEFARKCNEYEIVTKRDGIVLLDKRVKR